MKKQYTIKKCEITGRYIISIPSINVTCVVSPDGRSKKEIVKEVCQRYGIPAQEYQPDGGFILPLAK